jgi:K+-sensing histidine kinase KdpD
MTDSVKVENQPLRAFAPGALGYAGALALVVVATLAGWPIALLWGNAPVVLLYIPATLGAAIFAGLRPALLAAVASTLAYNYVFTAPYRTLLIHSPADVVTVVVLFVVAVATSHLAGSLREQARKAAAHASRNATIAGFARRLLSCAGDDEIAGVAVSELARLFDCNAVLVTGRDAPRVMAAAPARNDLAPSDLAAAALTLNTGEPAGRGVKRVHLADWRFQPVASNEAVTAAVGLPPVGDDQLPLLDSLLDQVALALERARLEREAREFVAVREHDRLRAALLASIGQDIKPRLTAIAAASRALRRGGTADKAHVAAIASETAKLDRYIDTLLDLGPGGDREPIAAGPLAIDLHNRSVSRDGHAVHLTPKEYAVLAELAKQPGRVLTHAQLLRAVWGPAQRDQIDYLRVAIRGLRRKLEADPAQPELILNEPAVGYRLAS